MTSARTSRAWARRTAFPAVAVLLHALVCALVWFAPLKGGAVAGPGAAAQPREEAIDLDLDVAASAEPVAATAAATPAEPQRAAEEPPADQDRTRAKTTASLATRAPPREPSVSPVEPTGPERSGPAAPNGADAPGSADARSLQLTVRRPEDIGIGGPNRFLPKSAAAVEDAESRRAVDHALRDPGRERERELGLGPEGPVLTALAESTATSTAPVRGRAVFVATSNAAGEITSIELADAEGSRAGWADAGQLALAALRGKKLRLPPKTTRAVMRIEVTSAWKLPSGQDPGTDITLFHIPLSKGEGKDSAKMSILDPIPKIHVDYLEIGGPGGAKIPIVSIQIDLFHTNVDPTNIGARARRTVHTHSLDTQLM